MRRKKKMEHGRIEFTDYPNKGGVQTSRLTDSIINWLSDSLKKRDVLIAQLTKRITTLEQEGKRMAEDLSRLDAEVSRLDSNEQQEEAEISTLKAQAVVLQAQLDNAGGDQAAIDARVAHLHAINERIEALVGASSGTVASSTPDVPTASEPTTTNG